MSSRKSNLLQSARPHVTAEAKLSSSVQRGDGCPHTNDELLSSISDFLYCFDLQGRFTFVNKPLLDLWGISLEQAKGKNFFDLHYPAELAAKLQAQIQQVVKTKKKIVDQTPYTNPAGQRGEYEYIFTPILNNDGSVKAVAGTTRDITELKNLEKDRQDFLLALETERSNLKAIVAQAPAFVCTLRGPNHIFELANDLYYRLIGGRDIVGKPVREALPEVAGQGFIELLDSVFHSGQTFTGNEMPVLLYSGDGVALERRFVNFVYQPIRGSDGAVFGIFVHGFDVTELVQSRPAIRESEEKLRLATEAAQLGIWVWNTDQDTASWENSRPAEIFGISSEDAPISEARFRSEFIHPEDLARFDAAKATAQSGADFYFLGRIRRPDFSERWIELTGRGKKERDGSVHSIVGTIADVTQRTLSSEQVQKTAEANAKFRTMFDQGFQLAGLLSPDGILLEANRSSLESCGFTHAQVLGKAFWDCGWWNPSEELQAIIKAGCAEAAAGNLFRKECIYFISDGSRRHVDLIIAPVKDEHGKVLFLAPTGVDITEQKSADMALKATEAQGERQKRIYEAILSNTPDFAYVFDLNYRVIYANTTLLHMWGRSAEDTIGKGFLEIGYEPWHAEMHEREIDQVVATKLPIRGEVPFNGTFGKRIYDYIFVPIIGEDGEVEAVAGTTRDVTDRKRNEEDREQLLTSERAARSEVERVSRMKDEFLATLSHELRTPLNAMLGWAQILRRKPPTPEILNQGLSVIDRNARLQAQLIADLLDMSGIISGKMRLEILRVELPLVIESALESIRPAADAKGVRLQSALQAIPESVFGDAGRIQQVIWNLLSNAVKFTPRDGYVEVALALIDSYIQISVTDSGKGIAAEFLPHVFERFRQADSSTSRAHGGLGLGLAIVKQLTELHGGSVSVDSKGLGCGTTFSVCLPMSPARTGPTIGSRTLLESVEPSPSDYDSPDLNGRRILVVDDESDARELVKRLLEECGASIVLASSSAEALAHIESQKFDAILSDIGLPEQDGYQFIRRLRSTENRTPAAALTAFARVEDRAFALESGYQAHISKPVNAAELLATVASLIFQTK